ncbi:MAG TPA: penicillin-binding transpeptidase domain-containing protein [Rhabdochlamydiaceae bacterium]|jgi:beta-lactamase class D
MLYRIALLLVLPFVFLWAEENFLLLDFRTGEVVQQSGDSLDVRMTPCSTFKIPLCLMGFDRGILQDERHPEWPYVEGYLNYRDSWMAAQNPRSWIENSCVWYSQVLAARMGLDVMQSYLDVWDYGNRDLSGNPGKMDGISRAWLSSSLKISPREQIFFLQKFLGKQLLVSEYASEMTKRLLFLEELEGGWKLFGRGGLCGAKILEREVGWFVGWIEKDERVFIFAYNIQEATVIPSQRAVRTKQLLRDSTVMQRD